MSEELKKELIRGFDLQIKRELGGIKIVPISRFGSMFLVLASECQKRGKLRKDMKELADDLGLKILE